MKNELETQEIVLETTSKEAASQSPAEFLRGLFLERKQRNLAYSTRAFARDLGMSQALVSLVMNGKRPLTIKQAAQISVLFGFSKEQAESFIENTLLALPANAKMAKRLRQAKLKGENRAPVYKNYELERFKAIGQWYHLAILDLTTTKWFRSNLAWIARRLGISTIEARDAVTRLLDMGLLEQKDGNLHKTANKIYFATKRSEPAVRSFHQQMIGKALEQLQHTDDEAFDARQISSMTMAIPKSSLALAKERIQAFQKELATLLCVGDCDEVYQLNIQMFPLTKSTENKSKKEGDLK
ncbi:TIGR02147 family protein [Bdellovibrionota bacterium FG-2]